MHKSDNIKCNHAIEENILKKKKRIFCLVKMVLHAYTHVYFEGLDRFTSECFGVKTVIYILNMLR